MIKMKTAVTSASILTSAALVLPALAQPAQGEIDAEANVGASAETAEDQVTTGTATGTSNAALEAELDGGADVGAETAEDDGAEVNGTGGTIPNRLPDTGGGWGANQR